MPKYLRQPFGRFQISYGQSLTLLFVILLLSSALKLSVWMFVLYQDPAGFLDPDSMDYHNPARAMLYTATFVNSPERPEVIETYRTPGYPLFLAGVYWLWGEHYAAVIPIQILLSLGILGFVFGIARKLWGVGVALVAALLYALDIVSFTYSLKLMPETLFTLLLMAMVFAGIHLIHGQRKGQWAWALGLFLALMTFVRPISYYLLVPVGLVFLWVAVGQKWDRPRIFSMLAGLILPSLILIGGWQLRNYLLTGVGQYSSVEGTNLLYRQGAAILAEQDGIDLDEAKLKLWQENSTEDDLGVGRQSTVVDAYRKQQALYLILQNPTIFVKTQIYGSVRLLAAPGEGPFLRMLGVSMGKMELIAHYVHRFESPLAVVFTPLQYYADYVRRFGNPLASISAFLALVYLVIIYSGILIWGWRCIGERKNSSVHIFMWSIVFYFVMISAGHWDPRFRIPITAIVLLYSARGWRYAQDWFLSKRSKGILLRQTQENR